MRRDLTAPHGQHGLDEPGDAGGGFQVSDVRLHRPKSQRVVGAAAGTENLGERPHLDRVAQRRPGSVRLDVAHLGRRDARRGQRLPDHLLLGAAAGRGQPVAPAVLVDCGAADHSEYVVPGRQRRGQPPHDHHAAALPAHVAVRGGVERLAPPVGRQHLAAGQGERGLRGEQQVDAAGQGQVALAQPQARRGQVQRRQRGGAGGVHHHAGAFQAEHVREPVRGEVGWRPGCRVPVDRRRVGRGRSQPLVVAAAHPDEDAGPAAPQGVGGRPGVLQRLPGDLQQYPVLRVHVHRVLWWYPEQRRVELPDPVNEPRPAGVCAARHPGHRVVVRVHIPAVGRHLADPRPAAGKQAPECLRPVDTAGEPAPDPYNDHGVRGGLRGPARRPVRRRVTGQRGSGGLDGGMVPGDRVGHVAAEPAREGGGDGHRPDRVQPVGTERLADVDRARVEADVRGDQGPDLLGDVGRM